MSAYYNEIDPNAAEWLRQLIKDGHIAPGEVDERSIVDVKADDLKGFTQCHFFAGVGIWSAAFRLAGWPDDRPVWSGSCPCQSFSVAGKGKGTDDHRDLWPVFASLISECRPEYVFGEQVEAAIGFGWLDRLRTDMEAEAYAVGSCVLGAHSAGADHIRQRLWWVANAKETIRRGVRTEHAGGRSAQAGGPGGAAGEHGGLADMQREGPQGHAWDERDRNEPGRVGTVEAGPVAQGGEPDFNLWRDSRWHQCRDGKQRRVPSVRAERVGDSTSEQHGNEAKQAGRHDSGGQRATCDRTADTPPPQPRIQLVADAGSAPCSGVDAGWDGSFFPLAQKTEGRVMILKGAGNAVNLGTCAAFIAAVK